MSSSLGDLQPLAPRRRPSVGTPRGPAEMNGSGSSSSRPTGQLAPRYNPSWMSFRRQTNAADLWRRYCHDARELLDSIGLPKPLRNNEKKFRDFMTRGSFEEFRLAALDDTQLQALWRFVNHVVPFDMDVTLFDAFNDEYRRRFSD